MSKTPEQARSIIITSLVITAAAAEAKQIGAAALKSSDSANPAGAPKLFEPLFGSAALGVLLFGIGSFAPEVAAGFAVTAAITSVLVNGGSLFKVLGPVGSRPTTPTGGTSHVGTVNNMPAAPPSSIGQRLTRLGSFIGF